MDGDVTPQNDAVERKSETTPLVILAYNVPTEFTSHNFKEFMVRNFPTAKQISIIAPFPWQDRTDAAWKVVCHDRLAYEAILEKPDIWIRRDSAGKASIAITFVPGDSDDITSIPSKTDENALMEAHCQSKK